MFGENLSSLNPGNFVAWLMGAILFIIMMERAQAQVYQTDLWTAIEEGIDKLIKKAFPNSRKDIFDLKPWISAAACIYIVFSINIDFFSYLFQTGSPWATKVATGLVVAGGSTGVVKMLKKYNKLKTAINESKIAEINNKPKE